MARRIRWCALLALALVGGILALTTFYATSDDAFISLRYAQNLLEGEGLRFNPGGTPVEGLSNLLFTMALLPLLAGGVSGLLAVKWLGLASHLGAILLLPGLCRECRAERHGAWHLTGSALLAASAYAAFWAVAGLETSFHAFLIVLAAAIAAVECRKGRVLWTPLAFLLVTISRPEGILLSMCTFLAQWSLIRWNVRVVGAWGLGMGLPCVLLLATRFLYYGSLLPNTYQAKMVIGVEAASRGLQYLWQFFVDGGFLVVLPAGLLLWAPARRRSAGPFVLIPASLILGQLLFIILSGGDFMPGYRFVVPVYPLLCALSGLTLTAFASTILRRGSRAAIVGVTLFLCVVSFSYQSHGIQTHPRRSWLIHNRAWPTYLLQTDLKDTWLEGHQAVGDYIRTRSRPGDVLALTEAGVIPYYAGLKVIDLLGLNDREIAAILHAGRGARAADDPGAMRLALRSIAQYVLLQKPRWIVLDGHLNAVTGSFVPREGIGRALLMNANRSEYRRVFTALLYDRTWSEFGVDRVAVVFERVRAAEVAPPDGAAAPRREDARSRGRG